tara:strand:- start:451 stop:945 length:495 start_codon:yes stop_codon:yes gene_type:complete
MARKPIWKQIEGMSSRARSENIKTHTSNLKGFVITTEAIIDKLTILRKKIVRSEKKILRALETEKEAEAISEILRLRMLRVEEMVELSALSLVRSNRFYNQLVLDVTRGVEANVKYDAESIKGMVPDDLKGLLSDSVEASDFYDILSNYKDKLSEFVQTQEGTQ